MVLACLLALHHLLFSFLTQGAEEAVNALLVWGGALVILVDQPAGWRPRPAPIGLVVAVLWRSQQITSLDGASRLLPLLAGLALALLAAPLRRLAAYGSVLLILALPVLMQGLSALIPTEKLSLLTAQFSTSLAGVSAGGLRGICPLAQGPSRWVADPEARRCSIPRSPQPRREAGAASPRAGDGRVVEVLQGAEEGWFSPCSWTTWHRKLGTTPSGLEEPASVAGRGDSAAGSARDAHRAQRRGR
jgi:hypothetical protein